jgi:hypothetical protein
MKEAANNTRPTLNVIFILVTRPSIRPDGSVVNIPFRFHAGGIEMESGRYVVRPYEDNVLRFSALRTATAQPEIMILGNQAGSGSGTLVFLECGDRYLLCKAFWPAVRAERTKDESSCAAQRNSQPINMLIH